MVCGRKDAKFPRSLLRGSLESDTSAKPVSGQCDKPTLRGAFHPGEIGCEMACLH